MLDSRRVWPPACHQARKVLGSDSKTQLDGESFLLTLCANLGRSRCACGSLCVRRVGFGGAGLLACTTQRGSPACCRVCDHGRYREGNTPTGQGGGGTAPCVHYLCSTYSALHIFTFFWGAGGGGVQLAIVVFHNTYWNIL